MSDILPGGRRYWAIQLTKLPEFVSDTTRDEWVWKNLFVKDTFLSGASVDLPQLRIDLVLTARKPVTEEALDIAVDQAMARRQEELGDIASLAPVRTYPPEPLGGPYTTIIRFADRGLLSPVILILGGLTALTLVRGALSRRR